MKIRFLTVLFLFMGLIPALSHAACSNNEDGEPGQLGQIETFFADNQMRYCDGNNWIDMGQPGTGGFGNLDPKIMKSYSKYRGVFSMVSNGNMIYYADHHAGVLGILDVSTPSAPTLVSWLEDMDDFLYIHSSQRGISDIDISGNYVFAVLTQAQSGKDLIIVDVSDPANPSITASLSLADANRRIGNVRVQGNYVYLLDEGANEGLLVVDISTITSPVEVGFVGFTTDSNYHKTNKMTVDGNYVYVGLSQGDALQIIDVSTPSAPVLRGSITKGDDADFEEITNIGVFDGVLYVATNALRDKMMSIDITDPDNPVVRDRLDLEALCRADDINVGFKTPSYRNDGRIVRSGNTLFFTAQDLVVAVNITDPDNLSGYCKTDRWEGDQDAQALIGTTLFTGSFSLKAWDVTDPSNMVRDFYPDIKFGPDGRYNVQNLRFIADRTAVFLTTYYFYNTYNFLTLYDITDALNPVYASTININPYLFNTGGIEFFADDRYLYGLDFNGIIILDISDPYNPVIVNANTGWADKRADTGYLAGNFLFTYNGVSLPRKINVYNISNPATPVLLDTFTHPDLNTRTCKMLYDNGFLYMECHNPNTDPNQGIIIINAQDPTNLFHTATFEDPQIRAHPNTGQSPFKKGDYLFTIYNSNTNAANLFIFDVSDPFSPVIASTIDTDTGGASYNTTSIALLGDRYLLATHTAGITPFRVFDVNDPENPVYLEGLPVSVGVRKFYIQNNYVISNNYLYDMGTDIYGEFTKVCTAPEGKIGTMYYNFVQNVMKVCNGSGWEDLAAPGDGGAGCSFPGGVAGGLYYDFTANEYRFCEGDAWVPF